MFKKDVMNFIPSQRRTVLGLSLLMLLLLMLIGIHEVSAKATSPSADRSGSEIPARFGRVIYHHGEPGAKHLYILGIGHRDTLTRSNGAKTAPIQAEVYRIGEWLIANADIDLLLPEGFFSGKRDALPRKANIRRRTALMDDNKLQEKLGGRAYVNAEKLLMDRYGVPAGQVENGALYDEIVEKIKQMDDAGENSFGMLFEKLELDYLQDRRTAEILRKIPEVVNAQLRSGRISNGNAVLTIGISHLNQIIGWLKKDDVIIRSPAFSSLKDYISELGPLTKKFDITVIIPKTVAEDRDLLARTSLAEYVAPEKIAALKEDSDSK